MDQNGNKYHNSLRCHTPCTLPELTMSTLRVHNLPHIPSQMRHGRRMAWPPHSAQSSPTAPSYHTEPQLLVQHMPGKCIEWMSTHRYHSMHWQCKYTQYVFKVLINIHVLYAAVIHRAIYGPWHSQYCSVPEASLSVFLVLWGGLELPHSLLCVVVSLLVVGGHWNLLLVRRVVLRCRINLIFLSPFSIPWPLSAGRYVSEEGSLLHRLFRIRVHDREMSTVLQTA